MAAQLRSSHTAMDGTGVSKEVGVPDCISKRRLSCLNQVKTMGVKESV